MYRRLICWGIAYLVVVGALLALHRTAPPARPHSGAPLTAGSPDSWFAHIRPFCNPVEVELAEGREPAPPGVEGAAYAAACFALAGKVDRARDLINQLGESDRPRAAGVVFEVAHPVADAGDDRAAGPIMEMVVAYWPNHYMARYHAGMSEYALGQPDLARRNLAAFLDLYHDNDGWRRNAVEVLQRLGGAEAVERAAP
jgi:thioredoxin-like negative regulator of GroEL